MRISDEILIVSSHEKDRNYWKKELSKCNECNVVITDSVLEAINHWNRLYLNGVVPKLIITNWILEDDEVEHTKEGVTRSGSHFLLEYCSDMVDKDEVLFVIHTSSPEFVKKKLEGLPEEKSVNIIGKDEFSIPAAFIKIQKLLEHISTPSGFHNIHA